MSSPESFSEPGFSCRFRGPGCGRVHVTPDPGRDLICAQAAGCAGRTSGIAQVLLADA